MANDDADIADIHADATNSAAESYVWRYSFSIFRFGQKDGARNISACSVIENFLECSVHVLLLKFFGEKLCDKRNLKSILCSHQ